MRAGAPDVLGDGAFTYTAIHEASHYLGLAHPHDTVGATRDADGSPRYYDGFTWAFNSTAAPTTYSHTGARVLDPRPGDIARGHMAYYLKWADEALAEAGDAYFAAGKTTVGSLPAKAQRCARRRSRRSARPRRRSPASTSSGRRSPPSAPGGRRRRTATSLSA